MEQSMKDARVNRRTAKGALTRAGKLLTVVVEGKRPKQEVRDALTKVQQAFEDLVVKHDIYTKFIEEDEVYEQEEGWLGECQETFMALEINAKLYMDSLNTKGKVIAEKESQSGKGEGLPNTSKSQANHAIDHDSSVDIIKSTIYIVMSIKMYKTRSVTKTRSIERDFYSNTPQ